MCTTTRFVYLQDESYTKMKLRKHSRDNSFSTLTKSK